MSQAFRPQCCGKDMEHKGGALITACQLFTCATCHDYQRLPDSFIAQQQSLQDAMDGMHAAQQQFVRADMAALNARIEAEVAKLEPEMANTNPACGCPLCDCGGATARTSHSHWCSSMSASKCPSAGGGACPSVVKAPTVSVPSAGGLATTPDGFEARLHVGTADCGDCGEPLGWVRAQRVEKLCFHCEPF